VSSQYVDSRRPYVEQAEKLFSAYGEPMLGLCKRRLSEEDAWDVYHGLFLKIATKGLPGNIRNEKCYVYRTTLNAITDHLRKKKKYREKILESAEHRRLSSNINPATQVLHRDMWNKALEAIEELFSPSVNQVFVLKYKYQQTHEQIAERMGITKGTVDRYLSHGTKLLRETPQLYEKFFGVPDE